VFEDDGLEATVDRFSPHLIGQNRFGGLRFRLDGIDIDCWKLCDTWAFRRGLLTLRTWRDIVRASLLDIDGVAIRICDNVEAEYAPLQNAVERERVGICLPDTFDWTAAAFRMLCLAFKYRLGVDFELLSLVIDKHQIGEPAFRDMAVRRFSSKQWIMFLRYIREKLFWDPGMRDLVSRRLPFLDRCLAREHFLDSCRRSTVTAQMFLTFESDAEPAGCPDSRELLVC